MYVFKEHSRLDKCFLGHVYNLGFGRGLCVFIYDLLEMFPCVLGVYTALGVHPSVHG